VPRLLNQLGDQLLWMAEETGYSPLDATIVQQAWSELQQLPAPWETSSASTEESAVEFGELSLDGYDPEQSDLSQSHGVATPWLENETENKTENETEDDHPASIPLHALQQNAEDRLIENYDATEQLVEQLHEMEAVGSVTSPQEAEPLSQNPFAESFDSEEVVLDRYLEFEDQLLATAQRVVNQVDTAFAQQLSHCEVVIETPLACETLSTQLEEISPPVSEPVIEESLADELGELLVIEDLGRSSAAAVVPGNKYRQLFSSLEDASWETPVHSSVN